MHNLSMFGDSANAQQFPAGHEFFAAGDIGDVMYVVIAGEVEIVIHDKIVETVYRGGIFGEMALIDDSERSASARARTDVEVAPIDQKRFITLIGIHPFFSIEVMTVMADRLRRLNQALL